MNEGFPEQVGHYRIVRTLGAGAMGVVLEARDEWLERRVALKILPPDVAGDADRLARFEREARALALLNHPNIVTIHAIERQDGRPFLVMELVEGETLRDALARGPLWPRRFFDVALELARGLAAAHDRGITHRDLKPENVMLSAAGVKVLDFGLARAQPAALDDRATAAPVTQPGEIVGTVPYMSPEQVAGQPVDARSDVFSLGAVLFEMAAGTAAFAGDTPMHVASAILRDDPPSLAGRGVPMPLAAIVARCLAKEPAARYATAGEVLAALTAVRTDAVPPALSSRTDASRAIAVLPFVDLSPARDHAYFCDGMADEIAAALARVPALRLAARTSAFQFRGDAHDVREIGRRLDVDWVLEGSVRAAGTRVRVTVTLVATADGYQVWSSRFDRELEDVFEVQDEIARGTVDALQLEMAGPLAATPAADVEAYTLYLKGRHEWGRRTESGFFRAIDYFRGALERDDTYAQAHGALAAAFVTRAMYGLVVPEDAMPDARDAAEEALRLSPGLAEPRAALAVVRALYDWEWTAAEREFELAVRANPWFTVARQWYASTCLVPLGRFDDARAQLAQAADVDPLSASTPASLAVLEHYAGRDAEARAAIERALEIEPAFPVAHLFLAQLHAEAGRLDDARRALALVPPDHGSPEFLAASGYVAARAGDAAEAERLCGALDDLARTRYVSPVLLAEIHTGLGDRAAALDELERAAAARALDLPGIAVRPTFRPLRDEPRFIALVRRMGLGVW